MSGGRVPMLSTFLISPQNSSSRPRGHCKKWWRVQMDKRCMHRIFCDLMFLRKTASCAWMRERSRRCIGNSYMASLEMGQPWIDSLIGSIFVDLIQGWQAVDHGSPAQPLTRVLSQICTLCPPCNLPGIHRKWKNTEQDIKTPTGNEKRRVAILIPWSLRG